MNEKIGYVLAIGVSVGLLILAGLFIFNLQKSHLSQSPPTLENLPTPSVEDKSITSLLDGLENTTKIYCLSTETDATGAPLAELRVGQSMVGAGSVLTNTGSASLRTSFVTSPTQIYVWRELPERQVQGNLFSLQTTPLATLTTTQPELQFLSTLFQFECVAWQPDPTLFVVPTDITF